MSTRHYHTPPTSVSGRAQCPVCHKAVYSQAGIHPQCAVRQSDPPRPKTKPEAPAPAELIAEGSPEAESISVKAPVKAKVKAFSRSAPA